MERIQALNSHFTAASPNYNGRSVGAKHDDDVVIVSYARTAMTRSKKGPQKDTAVEQMLKPVFQDVLRKANNLDPKMVGEIVIGNVLQPGGGNTTARMGQMLAGIPYDVPLIAINRMCSSGLQSVMSVANQISAGEIDIGIGGGVESMSQYDMMGQVDPAKLSDESFSNEQSQKCLMGMGDTSENVAEKYGITRLQQDRMAFESHQKAAHALKMGWSQAEITPYKTIVLDKEGNEKEVLVDRDDGCRPQTTMEGLAKLKPVFRKGGSTTAGNASQTTDGAAVVLVARRSTANRLGLPIKGRILGFAVAGVPPEIMGIGPAVAIPKALAKCGLSVRDIDCWEINEAFASQATYCVEKLNIPREKLNRRGGAIALGHPLGMTGARMVSTLFHELERTNERTGVISMCIGTGMGAAGVFERE